MKLQFDYSPLLEFLLESIVIRRESYILLESICSPLVKSLVSEILGPNLSLGTLAFLFSASAKILVVDTQLSLLYSLDLITLLFLMNFFGSLWSITTN